MSNPLLAARSLLNLPSVYRAFTSAVTVDLSQFIAEYLQPQPGSRVLDIGCGPGDMLAHLPNVQYVGFDIDEQYIQSAIERFGSRGKFFCRKVSEQVLHEMQEEKFDIVTAIGVVHHLDDAEAADLFRLAHNVLRPGGMLVTRDGCYTPDQSLVVRKLLDMDRGRYVRTQEQYLALAHSVFEKCTPSLRQDLLRIPYNHLILQCQKD